MVKSHPGLTKAGSPSEIMLFQILPKLKEILNEIDFDSQVKNIHNLNK